MGMVKWERQISRDQSRDATSITVFVNTSVEAVVCTETDAVTLHCLQVLLIFINTTLRAKYEYLFIVHLSKFCFYKLIFLS